MTEINKCRLCNGDFFEIPLLKYPNSPCSAQGFLDNLQDLNDTVDLVIYQCKCCGLVQHALQPVRYYKEVIRAIAFSPEMARFRVNQLGMWLSENSLSEKRILEIGSGKGEYLDLLKNAGANYAFGIEAAIQSVEYARSRNLHVEQGYLTKEFKNPWGEKFDAFAIFSFLEHWPDLNESLRKLTDLLNDEAIGIVEVPNFDFIMSNGMYSEFTTDHIFYFDKNTLKNVLELNGFEVKSIETVWHDYILSAKVKKRKLLQTELFIERKDSIISKLKFYVEKFAKEDIVIWGAGHQALAIISMSNLKDNVSHIIDSATFKQSKYTPGSHMLIKNPESIRNDKPRAVIVIAASYSDEVANFIKVNYKEVKNIVIVREDNLEEILIE